MQSEIKEISKLINMNEDACEFYESAQEKAESPQMEKTFSELESLHKSVVVNLQNYLRTKGKDVEAQETASGQIRQFWGELMANISNDVDETLVKHLEEAEDRCLHSVQNIMEHDDIPVSTKTMLQKEYNALRKSHDYMKALKDCMKAA